MTFAEKLDFLMTLTKTTNSALAARVALDASYISRLRRGKRLMPKDEGIIQGMAASLARRVVEDYQKRALSDALKLASLPGDAGAFAEELARWLLHDAAAGAERVGMFLSGLSGLGNRSAPARPPEDCQLPFPLDAMSVYYGVEGKRRAAEYFLCEVAAGEKPQTLLLFSDESTAWMTEDPVFAERWAKLMGRVLSRGNRIKIIHTISRELDEMLSAISQWMPLYMSGAIEPYFYPKKRDGIFKRTLFIAPETAAVVSNSVGDQIAAAANILYRDPAAVGSFAEEFRQYLRLCRPLMRIFTARDQDGYSRTILEFERERADTIMKTESLSLLTMPERLLAGILRRSGADECSNFSIHETRRGSFLENLRSNRFTEIISLPDIEAVKSGGVKVSMSDMLGGGAVYYDPAEFAAHLEQVLSLLGSCENYHVHLAGKPTEDRYMVYAREELGVIVAKTSQPPVVLAMSEGNMAAAFWDFLKNIIGEKAYQQTDRAAVSGALSRYLQSLRAALRAG